MLSAATACTRYCCCVLLLLPASLAGGASESASGTAARSTAAAHVKPCRWVVPPMVPISPVQVARERSEWQQRPNVVGVRRRLVQSTAHDAAAAAAPKPAQPHLTRPFRAKRECKCEWMAGPSWLDPPPHSAPRAASPLHMNPLTGTGMYDASVRLS